MGRLILTLKSDLCASTGQAFSSVIDSDIAVDSFGLPYIPARRIKGCLRDAAKYIDVENEIIKKLFGYTGREDPGLLKIGNGYLEHSDALKKVLSGPTGFTPQRVTELFCYIKSQTALDGDTVRENSLRFTRVLSHYLPYGKKDETKFVFDISGVPKEYKEDFERICKALRHIGLMRTRGLGFVMARYDHEYKKTSNVEPKVFQRGDDYYIPLHIFLTEPLLMASKDNTGCLDYVPGTAVLGAFARLAVLHGIEPPTTFEEIFLSGKVSFGNLYISDKDGNESVPAPHFLRKLKSEDSERDGKIVTEYELKSKKPEADRSDDTQSYESKQETPKVLKDKFVSAGEIKKVLDVSNETQYHYTRSGDAGLYTQNAISAGQYLYGEVTSSSEKLLKQLAKLLKTGDFRLGRSKTAQYSGCRLLEFKEHPGKAAPSVKGEVIFTLESDVILTDGNGINTIDPKALKKTLGIPDDKPAEFNLGFKIIHGYNAKRNMRNLPVNAFAMGSTVTVKDYDAVSTPSDRIGCRTAEGFGKIRVHTKEEVIKGSLTATTQPVSPEKPDNETGCDEVVKEAFAKLFEYEKAKNEAIKKAEERFGDNKQSFTKNNLNAAFIGVVTRVVETSKTANEALEKIDRIKDESKKEIIKKILGESLCEEHPDELKLLGMLTVLRLARYRLKLLSEEGVNNE